MKKTNFKKEQYLLMDHTLIIELNRISDTLQQQMMDSKRRFKVSDIISTGKNAFHTLWPDIDPLNKDNKHSKREFKGLYAFATIAGKDIDWQYIGISQTIKRRFRGHVLRSNKNSATWAYLMQKSIEEIPRVQKEIIHPCYFTFVQVQDNVLLHMAEVFCVNKLRATWNSFETH
jgi:hypothetical protein